jgi:hypothetical protein
MILRIKKGQVLSEIKGLELDFELDVNNKATVEIVIDKETGSYLSGRGAGSLLMEVILKVSLICGVIL